MTYPSLCTPLLRPLLVKYTISLSLSRNGRGSLLILNLAWSCSMAMNCRFRLMKARHCLGDQASFPTGITSQTPPVATIPRISLSRTVRNNGHGITFVKMGLATETVSGGALTTVKILTATRAVKTATTLVTPTGTILAVANTRARPMVVPDIITRRKVGTTTTTGHPTWNAWSNHAT